MDITENEQPLTPNFRVYAAIIPGADGHRADFWAPDRESAARMAPLILPPAFCATRSVGEIIRRDDGTIDEEETRDAYREYITDPVEYEAQIILDDGDETFLLQQFSGPLKPCFAKAVRTAALKYQELMKRDAKLPTSDWRIRIDATVVWKQTRAPHHDTQHNITLAQFTREQRDEVYGVKAEGLHGYPVWSIHVGFRAAQAAVDRCVRDGRAAWSVELFKVAETSPKFFPHLRLFHQ
jgi:hypothetical protein